MKELIIGLIVLTVIIIVFIIMRYFHIKKQFNFVEEKLNKIGQIKKSNNKAYDFTLKKDGLLIYVKLLLIKKTNELSINSRAHWQIDTDKKEVNLIKTNGFESLRPPKILIVSPNQKRIIKYINENEAVFVKYNELCFDFYLLTINEISKIPQIIKTIKKDAQEIN